jgi:hypothetical protein
VTEQRKTIQAAAEIERLRQRVQELEAVAKTAMRFVPAPESMAGFDDPDAPEEVRELIELAKWLYSTEHPNG